MASFRKQLDHLRHGIRRDFQDIPSRSARARASIKRVRPWVSGRIGNIETQIFREMVFGGNREDRLFTSGELARAIYAHPAH